MSCGELSARDSLICTACGGETAAFVPGLDQAKTALAATALLGGCLVVLADILGWGPDVPGFGGQGWAGAMTGVAGFFIAMMLTGQAMLAGTWREHVQVPHEDNDEHTEQALEEAIAAMLRRLPKNGALGRPWGPASAFFVLPTAFVLLLLAFWTAGWPPGAVADLVWPTIGALVFALVGGSLVFAWGSRKARRFRGVLTEAAQELAGAPALPIAERIELKSRVLVRLRQAVSMLEGGSMASGRLSFSAEEGPPDPSRDVAPVRYVRNPAATGAVLSFFGILASAALTAPVATTQGFTALTWGVGLGLSTVAVCASFWFAHKAAAIGVKRAEWLLGLWLTAGAVLGITVLLIVL
jgi:hypothetical protein